MRIQFFRSRCSFLSPLRPSACTSQVRNSEPVPDLNCTRESELPRAVLWGLSWGRHDRQLGDYRRARRGDKPELPSSRYVARGVA